MQRSLTTASRAIDIHHLNTAHVGKSQNQYIFAYSKLYKGWWRGQASSSMKLYTYNENPRLCVVQQIDEWSLIIRDQGSWGTMQLLLSFISSHKEITSSTVSNQMKGTLRLSGVDSLGNFSLESLGFSLVFYHNYLCY